MHEGLKKPRKLKRYEKIIERIGRLKEKYHVGSYFEEEQAILLTIEDLFMLFPVELLFELIQPHLSANNSVLAPVVVLRWVWQAIKSSLIHGLNVICIIIGTVHSRNSSSRSMGFILTLRGGGTSCTTISFKSRDLG